MKKVFCYSEFGAIGDGFTDDFLAIKRTHEVANASGGTVFADKGTYYIGKDSYGETIPVTTDVDFGDATFIFDDTELPPYHAGRTVNVFSVLPSESCQPIAVAPETFESLTLRKWQTGYIGFKLGYRALLVITNAEHKIAIRVGGNANSGQNMLDILLVDEDGNIDSSTPVMYDFDNITSIKAFPINETPLTINGGHFITRANRICTEFPDDKWLSGCQYYYYGRGIGVKRSNVTVKNLTHCVEGEGDEGYPYAGWLKFDTSNNVRVESCTFHTHKTYVQNAKFPNWMGTYDFAASASNNILWKNCTEFTDITDNTRYGVMQSNNCKNLTYDGCVLSRFDAHQGLCNATIKNSTIGRFINAIGIGTLHIENVTKLAPEYFIWLRDDYGSTWDGDIVIKNCRYEGRYMRGLMLAEKDKTEDEVCIFRGAYSNHFFGYPCSLPRSVSVDGFDVPNAKTLNLFYIKDLTVDAFTPNENNQNPVAKPEKISISRITGAIEFKIFADKELNSIFSADIK